MMGYYRRLSYIYLFEMTRKLVLTILSLLLIPAFSWAGGFTIEDSAVAATLKQQAPELYITEHTFSEEGANTFTKPLYLSNLNIDDTEWLIHFINASYLDLRNNNLSFQDLFILETKIEDFSNRVSYFPQNEITVPANITQSYGTKLTARLDIDDASPNNIYEWFQNGLLVSRTETPEIIIDSITLADAGAYMCKIRNSAFPNLILMTNTFNITVDGYDSTNIKCFDASNVSIETKLKSCEFGNDIVIDYSSIVLGNSSLKSMSLLNYHTKELLYKTEGHYFASLKDSLYSLVIKDLNNCTDTVTIRNKYESCEDSIQCFDISKFDYVLENNCDEGNLLFLFEDAVKPGTSDKINFDIIDFQGDTIKKINGLSTGLKDSLYYIVISDENKCVDSFTVFNQYKECPPIVCPEINTNVYTIVEDCEFGNSIILSPSNFYEDDVIFEYVIASKTHFENSTDTTYTNLKKDIYYLIVSNQAICYDSITIINDYSPCEILCADLSTLDYEISQQHCLTGNSFLYDSTTITPGTFAHHISIRDEDDLEITNLFGLKNSTITLSVTDHKTCHDSITIDVNFTPCEDNVIIASDENNNKFYIDSEGITRIYNSAGALIHSISTPSYWYAEDKNGQPVPAGDYYLITDDQSGITVSVFR